ncbi:MAG TPA: chaperone NapD [Nitrospirota bacterium]|nr:chaperone NapD [Nitrospirota bacterium]
MTNISSLVVKVSPADMEPALTVLTGSGLCDVHFHDSQKGMVVVTVEGNNVGEEMDKMKAIEKLPHVLGTALVYAYSEAELDAMDGKIMEKPGSPVPEDLKDV